MKHLLIVIATAMALVSCGGSPSGPSEASRKVPVIIGSIGDDDNSFIINGRTVAGRDLGRFDLPSFDLPVGENEISANVTGEVATLLFQTISPERGGVVSGSVSLLSGTDVDIHECGAGWGTIFGTRIRQTIKIRFTVTTATTGICE
jgi:hypothetical protein